MTNDPNRLADGGCKAKMFIDDILVFSLYYFNSYFGLYWREQQLANMFLFILCNICNRSTHISLSSVNTFISFVPFFTSIIFDAMWNDYFNDVMSVSYIWNFNVILFFIYQTSSIVSFVENNNLYRKFYFIKYFPQNNLSNSRGISI